MNYRVFYTANVRAEIGAQVDYLRGRAVSEAVIENWFARLLNKIDDLYEWPRSNPVDEAQTAKEGVEIRKLTFGDYLVRYHVDDDRQVVEVLSFIHGARRRER
jgi:mRNA-degrading endonuclease RelE of RelBE toxin-antitoxin system